MDMQDSASDLQRFPQGNLPTSADEQVNRGNNIQNNGEESAETATVSTTIRRHQEVRNNGNNGVRSPWLSGSIGIGVFKVSRSYCLVSIISALFAIVLAPIPIHTYQKPNWTDIATSDAHSSPSKNMATVLSVTTSTKSGEDETTKDTAFAGLLQRGDVSRPSVTIKGNDVGSKKDSVLSQGETSRVDSNDGSKDKNERDETKKRRRWPVGSKHTSQSVETKKSGEKLQGSPSQRKSNYKSMDPENHKSIFNLAMSSWRYEAQDAQSFDERSPDDLNEKDNPSSSRLKFWWKGREETNEEPTDGVTKAIPRSDDGATENGHCPVEIDETTNAGWKPSQVTVDDVWQWLDPILFNYDSFSELATMIIDKILKSTARLCILTNFMMTMTYLLHSAVAAWFLSHSNELEMPLDENNGGDVTMRQQRRRRQQLHDPTTTRTIDEATVVSPMVTDWSFVASSPAAAVSRERMGGFLAFKLLLISAVVTPDTLDVLILLTWFTLLGCLQSLDHLAHSTNTQLTDMGRSPNTGVVRLLFWVLGCVCVAAGLCIALFHTAGIGMILLLTCDCALLGAVVISHILKYYQSVLDDSHEKIIREMEERQLELHSANESNDQDGTNVSNEDEAVPVVGDQRDVIGVQGESPTAAAIMTPAEVREESGRLDREMEGLELLHSRRLALLETGIFFLEMTCHLLTVAHFCHIWSLHGVQFTLIDGVLALQLHSAISMAAAKLARRRTVHNIARDLHEEFPNATEHELKEASTSGDVCCICLRSMSCGGNVKKVHCGHLYHTQCLREIIERASNIESAKCPLCRALLVDRGVCQPVRNNNDQQRNNHAVQDTTNSEQATADAGPGRELGQRVEGERALFRLSTEGFLPAWLPFPAFSFEVVRRPPNGVQGLGPNETPQHVPAAAANGGLEEDPQQQHQEQERRQELPFFHRLLLLTGLMPMSPEEEARAIEQLVDMFPQYDRSDLLRELRDRGSIEAVAEVILLGIFRGVARGDDG